MTGSALAIILQGRRPGRAAGARPGITALNARSGVQVTGGGIDGWTPRVMDGGGDTTTHRLAEAGRHDRCHFAETGRTPMFILVGGGEDN